MESIITITGQPTMTDLKEFVKNYHKLLNYFVPKPKRIEYNDENFKGEVVRVVYKGRT